VRNSLIAKAALASAAVAMTLAAAAPSFAQPYAPPPGGGYYDAQGRYYYDPCKRDQNNRAVAGAVVGGILGAVVGNGLAARGVRTEGALIGGGVGAVGGAVVGHSTAACTPGQTYPQSSSYDGGYRQYGYDDGRYDGRYDSAYDSRYDDWDNDGDYAYDGGGRAYTIAQGSATADGCALAESAIYMPDGQVQKRFVRVCRDRSGRYQVVE
jgi:hypothetical protein